MSSAWSSKLMSSQESLELDAHHTTSAPATDHQIHGINELFAEENNEIPWWKSNFFLTKPVLFGTWDGVFTTCLINIFGVIVFLRSGWIVGQAGIAGAFFIVIATGIVALMTVLSAVGICERCRVESGGVYFLISHVMGSRVGGSFGILYCFGQAVSCALNMLGFGESISQLIGLDDNRWIVTITASVVLLLISIINAGGVKWVVKLQFVLLLVLILAALDFIVGSFLYKNTGENCDGWAIKHFDGNFWPAFTPQMDWFTVFGVFFPTITGILAGINMSGDLISPSHNIPNGSLAAILAGVILYLSFMITLGSTCQREKLLTDFNIAAQVSAIRVLLLAGLYIAALSSCLGAMYGTPRVLQSISMENVLPGTSVLAQGRGPNRVPIYALAVVAIVTLAFIFIGEINVLAPIVTMPFLLTYACVDYAYFVLAQTFDLQNEWEERIKRSSSTNDRHMIGKVNHEDSELDRLFPERATHRTFVTAETYTTMNNTWCPDQCDTDPHAFSSGMKKIQCKSRNWYSLWCNRWFSVIGAAIKLMIMFLVNWLYASVCVSSVFVIWVYIGTTNPAVKPGLAARFKFFHWLKDGLLQLLRGRSFQYEEIVVAPEHPGLDYVTTQLNEYSQDFANRKRYHQSGLVEGVAVKL